MQIGRKRKDESLVSEKGNITSDHRLKREGDQNMRFEDHIKAFGK